MRILVGLLMAAACGLAPAADLERGRAVWNFRCYYCHGYSGDAKTLASTFVTPRPRDFQSADPAQFPMERILRAIRDGVPGSTMKSFRGVISEEEIRDVAAFVRSEFLEKRARNTRYHTKEAGWPDHERYRDAYPFALGEIPLDTDEAWLSPAQQRGRRLFLETCITCHDRSKVSEPGPAWEPVKPRSAGSR